jgi:alkylation response protein AidB-like acyl-CoA dehydrogenase
MTETIAPAETVAEFRVRARAWLADNMEPLRGEPQARGHVDWDRERALQRELFAGGFAGICFPAEYGGLGLPIEYQHAFTEEALAYELPVHLSTPTLSILAATLLECGSPEQKARYLPGIIRGDHTWVQLLSEPNGGSDLAGCITRADLDGDEWILNGAKIWTSGADSADYGMCLARTNWDVPKHAGLGMFVVDLRQPGVTIEPIELASGVREFCQVFLDDVRLPTDAVVGAADEGWAVAGAMLSAEREAAGGASPFISGHNLGAPGKTTTRNFAAEIARTRGTGGDVGVQELIGESRMLDLVQRALLERITVGTERGVLPPTAGSLLRLFSADAHVRKDEIAMTVAGPLGVTWEAGDAMALEVAAAYSIRQADALAGGSAEIQRNIISERVLGLPRELAGDRGIPYRDVQRGGATRSAEHG